jgi:hypothetical protein
MILEVINKHFPARALEWFGGFVMLAWGIYVYTHPTLFTDPRIATLFKGLADIAWFVPPNVSWGLFAVTIATARIVALWINGSRPVATPRVRLAASFASAFVWTQVLVGLLKADVPNTGLVVYTALIGADIYSAFRATRDVVATSRVINVNKQARGNYVERNTGGVEYS